MGGDFDRAAALFREALVYAGQLRDVLITEFCLEGLAVAAGGLQRPRQVALLVGAADRLCARSGMPAPGAEASECRRTVPGDMPISEVIRAASEALGPAAFSAMRATARTLPLAQAIDEVFAADEPHHAAVRSAFPDGLTRRLGQPRDC